MFTVTVGLMLYKYAVVAQCQRKREEGPDNLYRLIVAVGVTLHGLCGRRRYGQRAGFSVSLGSWQAAGYRG